MSEKRPVKEVMMSLEEKFQMNERYPVRLQLLKTGIRKNLEYAKDLIRKDGRKKQQVQIVLKIVEEDLKDLTYYYSKKKHEAFANKADNLNPDKMSHTYQLSNYQGTNQA